MEQQIDRRNLDKELENAGEAGGVVPPKTPGTQPTGDGPAAPRVVGDNNPLPPKDPATEVRNADDPQTLFTKAQVQAMIDAALRSFQAEAARKPDAQPKDKKKPEERRVADECDSHTPHRNGGASRDVLTEMNTLRREVDELRALRNTARAGGPSGNSPFCIEIVEDPIPHNYRPINFEYDGTMDPGEHLSRFNNTASLHQLTGGVKCRAFATTLTGPAQSWFTSLLPNSVRSFDQLSGLFLNQFASAKKCKKNALSLFSLKQKERENLRSYIRRFTTATLDVPTTSDEVLMAALTQGLRDGDFFRALSLEPSPSFDDLLKRSGRFINLEEAQQQKFEESNKSIPARAENVGDARRSKEHVASRKDTGPKQETGPPRGPRYSSYQPLVASLSHILFKIEKRPDLRWPRFSREPPRRNPALGTFCHFHNEYGHETDNCGHLKDEVERLIRDNKIGDFVKLDPPAPPQGQKRPGNFTNTGARPPPPPPDAPKRGFIQMISGGPTGGDTHRARRRYLGEIKNNKEPCYLPHPTTIQFGPEDVTSTAGQNDDPLVLTISVGGYDVARAFVDTGSSVDVLYNKCYQQMNLTLPIFPVSTPLYGFTGSSILPIGQVKIPVTLGTYPFVKTQVVNFLIVDGPSAYNIIIGRPMLNAFQAVPSTIHMKLKFPTEEGVGEVIGDRTQARSCYVETVKQAEKQKREHGINEDLGDEKRPRVDPEEKVAHIQPMDEVIWIDVLPGGERRTRISAELEPVLRDELIGLLRANSDVFAWQPTDLTGISPELAVHRLNIKPDCKPVKQKRRHFGAEKDDIIATEVRRLLSIGHIREIQFSTWLSNAVLVKKSNNKWRMCIDFRDLNAACPKDDYPLPRIDQLVDSTAGCEMLSMMDASQGYHQIPLDPRDQPAVSFVTAIGTFCYVVMPFGLKNAGATYQRLMDKMFRPQLGRNIEVYVDDMLVKSRKRATHINDLRETFATLRQFGMKLNPEKCAFGVKAGKFLGYVVTERGIEANQDKVRAILDTIPPRTIKEIQSLAGKVVSLSRFISRLADRSHPFFKVLRKNSQFEWTEECQKAFTGLKEVLAELPVLAKPEVGEILFVYLAAGPIAVSSVLFKEENGRQIPVYYVSKILTGVESRYSETELIAYALVLTARKLRPYFLSHAVVVRTSLPLRQVLSQPDTSGRIVRWAIELGQYDVAYQPRVAIKGQALVDFLQETTRSTNQGLWTLHVDGSSSVSGCGAGILVTDPEGKELEFAVKLPRVSNNEAEYEALARGLEILLKLGARKVQAFSDSQLVAQQLAGGYEIKNDRMSAYVVKIERLVGAFESCEVRQIPRESNVRADFLAKVGASVIDCSERKISILMAPPGELDVVEVTASSDWRTPIIAYLSRSEIIDPQQRDRILYKARHFYLRDGILYKRSFSSIDARCLGTDEVEYVLREVHRGGCGDHMGGKALALKLARAGYFWPGMRADALDHVKRCVQCQKFSPLIHQPGEEMTIMRSPCPFAQWGIDLVGPLPMTTGRKKFVIVAVDYFTKWVEAEPLSRITEDEVMSFIWKNICCRFGIPRNLISDNGTQFNGRKIRAWCEELKISQRFAAVAHPQANGQVEVTNRTIIQGLKKRLDEIGGSWVEELPSVLWAYRTTSKEATGETPFSLVYGTEAVIPVEVGMESLRIKEFDEDANSDGLRLNLDNIYDRREVAHLRMERSKNRIKTLYDQGVQKRQFQVGDWVLKQADALKNVGKMEPNWEGPYRVLKCLAGGAYELADDRGKALPRPWNICHLRRFFC